MNIYLDIDGVILGPESPKKGIDKLLKYLLKNYPDNTYWLTTHCKGGINRCGEWLRQNHLPEKLVAELEAKVKPTDWGVLKTDAIDFSQPFFWLDDSLLESERMVLSQHGALDSCMLIDKHDPKAIKTALKRIKSAKV